MRNKIEFGEARASQCIQSSIGIGSTKHTTNPRTKKSGTFFLVPDFLVREKLRVKGTERYF